MQSTRYEQRSVPPSPGSPQHQPKGVIDEYLLDQLVKFKELPPDVLSNDSTLGVVIKGFVGAKGEFADLCHWFDIMEWLCDIDSHLVNLTVALVKTHGTLRLVSACVDRSCVDASCTPACASRVYSWHNMCGGQT